MEGFLIACKAELAELEEHLAMLRNGRMTTGYEPRPPSPPMRVDTTSDTMADYERKIRDLKVLIASYEQTNAKGS